MLKKYFSGKDTPFWLVTLSVVIFLTLTKLIQDGMFMDGMLYTCVSHNLSKGIGTFWLPVFSPSYFNSGSPFFLEQPPLVFGIQSLFFKVLGDSMYVERVYIFLTMCITAFLIYLLWKIIYNEENEIRRIGWLPVFLWITIPSCSWSYSNNMMENTMGLFSLAAVISAIKAGESEKYRPGLLILSGFLVFLATLSKGVPGLFPLTVPFLYWIIIRKKTILYAFISTIIILLVPVVIYFILFRLPESRESLTFYVTQRLLGRINDDPTVGSRFYILKRLITELIPQIIFVAIIIISAKIKNPKIQFISHLRYSILFLSIGLAASVPLILTLVQRGFYLVPSFPYFALGFSVIVAPMILTLREKLSNNPKKHKILLNVSIIVFAFAILFTAMLKGKTSRDKDKLHDVYAIGKEIPGNSAITITQDLAPDYVLGCYFIRYFNISLFIDEPKEYYMIKKTTGFSNKAYEKLEIETSLYDIYRRK